MILEKIIYKRKIYERLLSWKKENGGKTAILIEGARQVGKSTVVKEFAEKEYKSHLIIDFSAVRQEVVDLFDELNDLNLFFSNLQFIYGVTLYERESVIVLDGVQHAPQVRQAIRQLVEDHRYDYIEIGSYLTISQELKVILSSTELAIKMFPMDYEEYCWASGEMEMITLLREHYEKKIPLSEVAHQKVLNHFKHYMLVGGMPGAVSEYLKTSDFIVADRVKRNILDLYKVDFFKLNPRGHISCIFDSIPGQLTSNASRFKASTADSSLKHRIINRLLPIMSESMAVNVAYNVSEPAVGIEAEEPSQSYKLFLGDNGLLVTLANKGQNPEENSIYQKLLSEDIQPDLNYLYLNVVAQLLTARGERLIYHIIPYQSKKHNYRVDFLLYRDKHVIPLEVKSSVYQTHKSLDAFCEMYSSQIGESYLIGTKNYRGDKDMTYLPVYMAMFI